jgi:hypothetical protein
MNAWVTRVLGVHLPTASATGQLPVGPATVRMLGATAAKLPQSLRPAGPPPAARTNGVLGAAASQPVPARANDLPAHIGKLAPEFIMAVQDELPTASAALAAGASLPGPDWMLDIGDRYSALLRDLQDWARLLTAAEQARAAADPPADTAAATPDQADLVEVYTQARSDCLEVQADVRARVDTLMAEFKHLQAQQPTA